MPKEPFADLKGGLELDEYGIPAMAVANSTLLEIDDYGESRESLEKDWETWLHHLPFDGKVALALCSMLKKRMEDLDPVKDAAAVQRIKRRITLVKGRAQRYFLTP